MSIDKDESKQNSEYNQNKDSFDLIQGFAIESLESLETLEDCLLKMAHKQKTPYSIVDLLGPLHTMRSNASALELTSIHHLIYQMECLIETMHKTEHLLDAQIISLILDATARLKIYCNALLEGISQGVLIAFSTLNTQLEQQDLETKLEKAYKRLKNVDNIDRPQIGELLIQQGDIKKEDLDRVLELQHQPTGALLVALGITTTERVSLALNRQQKTGTPKTSLRIEAKKLEHLANLSQSFLHEIANVDKNHHTLSRENNTDLSTIRTIGYKIWKEISELRKMPFSGLFQNLKKISKDLASQLKKNIDVSFYGETIEIEMEWIETLQNVLTHAIRNAIDHGIESEEARVALKKDPVGHIGFIAQKKHGEVTLTIIDDGIGLDAQEISKRARLLNIKDTTNLHDHHRWDVLFETVFSTRDSIGEISGSGVGLNVLREKIRNQGGNVWLESQHGLGTSLVIKFPTNIGHIEGMVIQCSGQKFVIPSDSVTEYVKPSQQQIKSLLSNEQKISIRGVDIPVLWLADLTGFSRSMFSTSQPFVLIIENAGDSYALIVDDVIGPQSVPLSFTTKTYHSIISENVILESGCVAGVISLKAIFSNNG